MKKSILCLLPLVCLSACSEVAIDESFDHKFICNENTDKELKIYVSDKKVILGAFEGADTDDVFKPKVSYDEYNNKIYTITADDLVDGVSRKYVGQIKVDNKELYMSNRFLIDNEGNGNYQTVADDPLKLVHNCQPSSN